MALLVHPGYRGLAEIGGAKVRFTDASITARQDVNIPDLITGHWDHLAMNYQKIEVGGTISGPVTDTFAGGAGSIWEWAANRTGDCGELSGEDINLYYFCPDGGQKSSRSFTNMRANSLTFSCAAGDIAQFSIDVIGTTAQDIGSDSPPLYTLEEKLVTWEKVGVSFAGGTSSGDLSSFKFSNFEFTIANNIEPVYAIGSGMNLFPYEIVPGMRTLNGSLSAYDIPDVNGFDGWDAYEANQGTTMTFSIGSTSVSFKVFFHRVEPASSVGPIISTVAFTGVGLQTTINV